jgi:hypothetical protein
MTACSSTKSGIGKMSAIPVIQKLEKAYIAHQRYIFLQNAGDAILKSGSLQGKSYEKDGTVSSFVANSITDLEPGEVTKILASGFGDGRQINITKYSCYDHEIPMKITFKRGFFGWRIN